MTRDLLCSPENRVQIFRAALVARDLRFVPQAHFRADFRSAGLVAEQNYFDAGIKPFPTGKRVPLNNSVMPLKRLCGREKSQHSIG